MIRIFGYTLFILSAGFPVGPESQQPPAQRSEAIFPQADKSPAVDNHGDPLPVGSFARIGTVRFRHPHLECFAYSPDGSILASGGYDNQVRFWDPATGKERQRSADHPNAVSCIAFSKDGALLATGCHDNKVRIWEVATGKLSHRPSGHPGTIQALGFSPDGKLLASGSWSNTLRVWDVKSGKRVKSCEVEQGHTIDGVAFSPDGRLLAVASSNRRIVLWDTASWNEQRTLEGHAEMVVGVAFSPDGRLLYSGSNDTTIRFWEVASGRELRRIGEEKANGSAEKNPNIIVSFALAPDGKSLAVVEVDGTLRLRDTGTGEELWSQKASQAYGVAVAYSPDGKTVATQTRCAIHLWDVASGKRLNPTNENEEAVMQLSFSHDGKLLGIGQGDKTVRLWDTDAHREIGKLDLVDGNPSSIAFSPNGKLLTCVDRRAGRAWLWDVPAQKLVRRIDSVRDRVSAVAFSPVGDLLVGSCRKEFVVWDVATGVERARFPGNPKPADQIAFSPDGDVMAVAEREGVTALCDPATGRRLQVLLPQDYLSNLLIYTPNGMAVLSTVGGDLADADTEIVLWEVATGQERCRLPGHKKQALTAATTPDGRFLASANFGSGTIHLRDLLRAREIGQVEGHVGGIRSLAFSPDGKVLASGGSDTTVLLWDMATLLRRNPGPASQVEPEKLGALWKDLRADAGTAFKAMAVLSGGDATVVSFMKDRFREVPVPTCREFDRLVEDLGNDEFAVRDKATKTFEKLGRLAEPILKRASCSRLPPEASRRVEGLMERLESRGWTGEELRLLRAIEVLEGAGTPQAVRLLEEIGERQPGLLAEATRRSLKRLKECCRVRP